MEGYYNRANQAKENGELVGWVTSNFPQEIIQAMDLCVIYPENHAATLAASGEDRIYCSQAEAMGFSNDICSYAKVNLGYLTNSGDTKRKIPMPDYLLCCSNICHQLMKWYQYLAFKLSIPMILIDIPYNTDYETDEIRMNYIRIQFWEAIKKLEEITGKKLEMEKLEQVMQLSSKVGEKWNQISDLLIEEPALFRGTDLFSYMGIVVCQRGRQETLEALTLLYEELKEKGNRKKQKDLKETECQSIENRRKSKKQYRILYEGICCWPGMIKLALSFASFNCNLVGAVYTNAYGIEYQTFDDMLRAYTHVPNAVSLEYARDMRLKEIEKKKCDGVLIHMSRTCKIWSGILYEMKQQMEEKTALPIVTFDGDQADSQCFSEAQYDTRLQGFCELMQERG